MNSKDPARTHWNKIPAVLALSLCVTALPRCSPGEGPHQADGAAKATASGGGGGQNVSFAEVLPIFQKRCSGCHNSGANDWTQEKNVRREALKNGILMQYVSSKYMPKAGSDESQKITDAERAKLVAWGNGVAGLSGGASGGGAPQTLTETHLAVISRCITCHGYNGHAVVEKAANLASHDPGYIVARLKGFLVADDKVGTMPSMLKKIFADNKLEYKVTASGEAELSPDTEELVNFIATYFNAQTVTPSPATFLTRQASFKPEEAKAFAAGRQVLADHACAACHSGPNFRPQPGFPMIFGQPVDYVTDRIVNQFKKGVGTAPMPDIISGLTDDEIKNVIFYITNVHPTQVVNQ